MKCMRPFLLLVLTPILMAPGPCLAGAYRLGATRVCSGNLGVGKNKTGYQIKVNASALRSGSSRNTRGYTIRVDAYPFIAQTSQTDAKLWAFYE